MTNDNGSAGSVTAAKAGNSSPETYTPKDRFELQAAHILKTLKTTLSDKAKIVWLGNLLKNTEEAGKDDLRYALRDLLQCQQKDL